MQVSPFPNFAAITPDKMRKIGSADALGSSSTAPSANAGKASQDDNVEQKFLDYARMSPAERLRANILKSMHLTEDELKAMPPEKQKAVEEKIEQLIKQQLDKNGNTPGQVVDLSA